MFDALGPPDPAFVRVKIRVHPHGEHYVRVPRTVRESLCKMMMMMNQMD